MKTNRSNEEQSIGILKAYQAGLGAEKLCRNELPPCRGLPQ